LKSYRKNKLHRAMPFRQTQGPELADGPRTANCTTTYFPSVCEAVEFDFCEEGLVIEF
jgi:hypothetical protein